VELTVSRSIHHMTIAARSDRLSFFDRGIIDQLGGFRHLNLPVPRHLLTAAERLRYHERVFVAPPWPEIFANDSERRHNFDEAAASYESLLRTYESFGYRAIVLPKVTVEPAPISSSTPQAGNIQQRPLAYPIVSPAKEIDHRTVGKHEQMGLLCGSSTSSHRRLSAGLAAASASAETRNRGGGGAMLDRAIVEVKRTSRPLVKFNDPQGVSATAISTSSARRHGGLPPPRSCRNRPPYIKDKNGKPFGRRCRQRARGRDHRGDLYVAAAGRNRTGREGSYITKVSGQSAASDTTSSERPAAEAAHRRPAPR
jgi:hypothetical protein